MSGEWRVSDAIGILGIKDGSWERLYEIETLSSVVFEAHLTTGESKYDKSKYRPIIENGDPTEGPTPEAIRGGGVVSKIMSGSSGRADGFGACARSSIS